MDANTIEGDYGWVFFHDSKAHLASGLFEDVQMGNSPLVVTRDGRAVFTGTHAPLEELLDELRASGELEPA